ncbi:22258_t:CDS:2, partial [Gigaspora rosea]
MPIRATCNQGSVIAFASIALLSLFKNWSFIISVKNGYMHFLQSSYPLESFKYKGKTYKTCANCFTSKAEKRKKLENDNTQTTIETNLAQFLCNYVASLNTNIENN